MVSQAQVIALPRPGEAYGPGLARSSGRRPWLAWAAVAGHALLIAVIAFALLAAIRGQPGNPTPEQLQQPEWLDGGPLELSPERGHFALTLSLAEDHSVTFSVPIARLVTPDLGYSHGKYVSLFSPGLSFVTLPGYLLGEKFGLAVVGAYAVISAFALANALLARAIARELGASAVASWLGAIAFLFGSPALVYAVSLFQHHVSLFLLLLPMYLLLKVRHAAVLLVVWLLYGVAIVVDYPNAFLMAPIAVLAAGRMFALRRQGPVIRASMKLGALTTVVAFALPLAFLLGFNYVSYGNSLQMSGTVATVKAIDNAGRPALPDQLGTGTAERFLHPEEQAKSAVTFFNTRNLLNGFYIQLLSPDRGVLYFAPVMFFGLLGIWFMRTFQRRALALIMAIVAINLTLYALWDDPWGGWAFGSRYLVPSYAMMGILIAIALTHLRWRGLFLAVFAAALVYSIFVNGLGALTSSSNPPQVEVLSLEQQSGHQEKYTWERNWDFLRAQGTKSFLYRRLAAGHLDPLRYFALFVSGLCLLTVVLIGCLSWQRRDGGRSSAGGLPHLKLG